MKRILNESINIGDTVNLYSELNEYPRSFIGQAKITNKLQDKTTAPQSIPYTKRPKKKYQIPARVKKIFSLEIPHFDKATLEFECNNFMKLVHSKGEQVIYNTKLFNNLTKEYCSTKTTFKLPDGLEFHDVPKADYSYSQGSSSTMGEGKKVIRLTESDLVRLVKKVLEEQFNRDVEYNNYDDERNDEMSNIDYDMDMRNNEITKSQLKDMINHYSEISCDGINQFNELEMYGRVPEWNIIYCLYYKGKSRSELFKKYKSM